MFFNKSVAFVVQELKREKLRKFFKINIMFQLQFKSQNLLSKFKPNSFVKIANSILMQTKTVKRREN